MQIYDKNSPGFDSVIEPSLIAGLKGGSGDGGSDTDNYNSLSNKPRINGVILSGNKTSDNLGLQDKISATNKISSDFINDKNSANKFMSEAEKTKLASLVNYDDTEIKEDISNIESSLNSKVSILEQMNGKKNWVDVNITSRTVSALEFTVNSDNTIVVNGNKPSSAVSLTINDAVQLPQGNYVLLDGSGVSSSALNITLFRNESSWAGTTATNGKLEFTANGTDTYYCRIYVNTAVDDVMFKPMIISKAVYDAGFTEYQPYGETNAELTVKMDITEGKNSFGRFLPASHRNWDFLFLYPCIFLDKKEIRIPPDFLILDSRFNDNYKGTSEAITVSYADIDSSAVIIAYEISSNEYKAFKYDTDLPQTEYIPLCTIRQTYGTVISDVPIYVDGKLFGVIDDNSKSFIRGINHRGFNQIAPENTIPAYALSKKYGFDTVETDISFTSDNVPVLLHDDTVDRTSNGTGNISNMTYEQVRALDFGSWKSEEYTGTKIPSFDEFVKFCRDVGLNIYAELKGTITQAQAELVANIIKKYHMENNTTWISFNSNNLTKMAEIFPSARIGFIVSTVSSSNVQTAISLKTTNNEVFIDCSSITDALIDECISGNIGVEKWTINTEVAMTSSNPYINGFTSDILIAAKVFNYYHRT